jgi:multiple sugar transport system substrate-binding protein
VPENKLFDVQAVSRQIYLGGIFLKTERIMLLGLVLGLVFSLTVCSAAGPHRVETTFWTDSPFVQPAFQSTIDMFVKAHPQYTIHLEAFPGSERPQKLALAKQAGTLPSIFFTASFTSMDEVHQGSVLPITDILKLYKDDISAQVLGQVKVKNNYYMLPIYTSSQGMLFNADYFKAAGLGKFVSKDPNAIALWTVADMENEILPALKKLFAGSAKYPLALYCGNEQNDSYMINMLRMLGGEVIKNGKVVAGSDNNTVKALDMLYDWMKKGYTNSDVVTKVAVQCNTDFQNQLCAISGGQLATYNNFKIAFKKGTSAAFDLRVAVVPRQIANGKGSGSMHTYIYGLAMMNVKKEQQKLAKDYMKWLSNEKKGALKDLNMLGMPACNSVIEAVKEEKPLFVSYQKMGEYIFDFTGGAPGYVATRSLLFPALQSKFSGKESSKDALHDYMNKANKIVTEYTSKSVALKSK